MTTPDGLTAEEREVLRGLDGASLFEYDGARARDRAADPDHVTADYDRRILLVTVDRAVRALARHVRDTGCEGLVRRYRRSADITASGLHIIVDYLRAHDDGMSGDWMNVMGVAEFSLGVAQEAAALASPEAPASGEDR